MTSTTLHIEAWRERARIVAWLRKQVAAHRDNGEHAVDPLRSDQLTVAWIIENYASEIEEGAHVNS